MLLIKNNIIDNIFKYLTKVIEFGIQKQKKIECGLNDWKMNYPKTEEQSINKSKRIDSKHGAVFTKIHVILITKFLLPHNLHFP